MAQIRTASYPICPLCAEHVEPETARNDEKGCAVHEDCYAAFILTKRRIYASISRSLVILRALATPEDEWTVT